MTLRTIPLEPVAVVLRRPFELRTDRDGNPLPDERTGEVVYVAEAVVPGLVTSRYQVDTDRPETVRVKQVGGHRCDAPAGTVVRLVTPRLTTWYTARRGQSDARSDVTIRVDRVEVAAGEVPRTRGGLLAHTASLDRDRDPMPRDLRPERALGDFGRAVAELGQATPPLSSGSTTNGRSSDPSDTGPPGRSFAVDQAVGGGDAGVQDRRSDR
jgi:hypothetical protein